MSLTPHGATTTESQVTQSVDSLPLPILLVAVESGAAGAAAPGESHPGLHPGSWPAVIPLTGGLPRSFHTPDGTMDAVPDAIDVELEASNLLTRAGLGSPDPPPKPKSRQRSTSLSPYLENQKEVPSGMDNHRQVAILRGTLYDLLCEILFLLILSALPYSCPLMSDF